MRQQGGLCHRDELKTVEFRKYLQLIHWTFPLERAIINTKGGLTMNLDKKTLKNIFLCVVGGIVCYWLLTETDRAAQLWKTISTILAPFAVGAALAFVLNVPMRAIEGKLQFIKAGKLRRGISMVLTILVVALIIAGVCMLLVPQIQKTVEDIAAQLPVFFSDIYKGIQTFLNENPEIREYVWPYWEKLVSSLSGGGAGVIDWEGLIEKTVDLVSNSLLPVFSGAISVVSSLATFVFNLVISFVFALYCLGQKEILARQGRKLLYAMAPEKFADETVRILRMTNSAFSNFITGQCLEAVILALLFVIAMMLFRMPYIPLISVLIGVTALIPLVGAFAGCILGAFFILVSDPLQAVTFVIMFLVIQQFEGNVIYPRVVGSSIGLPGMWVLLAVTVGGELMGVGGMLIMVPFASVLYTLLREFAHKRLALRSVDAAKLTPQPPELQSHFLMKRKQKKAAKAQKKQAEAEKEEVK